MLLLLAILMLPTPCHPQCNNQDGVTVCEQWGCDGEMYGGNAH